VLHTARHVSLYDWWQPEGANKCPFMWRTTRSFSPARSYSKWQNGHRSVVSGRLLAPFDCDLAWFLQRQMLAHHGSRGDFLISHSSLLRLLMEANSTSGNLWPMNLIRMLSGGLYRSFRGPLLEGVRDEDEFSPPRYSYMGQWQGDALYFRWMTRLVASSLYAICTTFFAWNQTKTKRRSPQFSSLIVGSRVTL